MNVVVLGAGPAGVTAATRAAELGAHTTLITRGEFGGMAATDGPAPVRTLAYAARLARGARQLPEYGIAARDATVDYAKLLERVRNVVHDVAARSSLRAEAERAGVTILENAGHVRFEGPHEVVSERGVRLRADRFILCCGGVSRRLDVPGSELTSTHTDAWALTEVPASLLVIGGGMTGLQVASIFQAFGSRVQLFQSGPRILSGEDEDLSAAVASGLRASGVVVREGFGTIERFERGPAGIRMVYAKDGVRESVEAVLAVVAIGWVADLEGLNLVESGVGRNERGFVQVDDFLRTTAPHIYAAGDVTGRYMVVPPAVHDGFAAATNALRGPTIRREAGRIPVAGFTEPEYGSVGMTERDARQRHETAVAIIRFDETTRTIIDGRTSGFCKLIADRSNGRILGCHVVGERAADIIQAVSIAMAGRLTVHELANVPLAFPTYVGILTRAAFRAAREIDPDTAVPAQGVEG
jgi:pyruvate/2-oxoglutarate dehydrogenase complex dihydrolipoamide dehydrogenase (E3) component